MIRENDPEDESEIGRAARDAERGMRRALQGMAEVEARKLEREQRIHREHYDEVRTRMDAADEAAKTESAKRDRQHRRTLTVSLAALAVSLVVGGWTIFGPADTPELPPAPAQEQVEPAPAQEQLPPAPTQGQLPPAPTQGQLPPPT